MMSMLNKKGRRLLNEEWSRVTDGRVNVTTALGYTMTLTGQARTLVTDDERNLILSRMGERIGVRVAKRLNALKV